MKKIEKATEWFRVNGIDTTNIDDKFLYVTLTLSDGRRKDVQLSEDEIGFRAHLYDEEVSSKTLFDTDYVIYDKFNDHVLQDSYGRVLIFGNEREAIEDLYGNECVVKCTDLPEHWKQKIINQIES